MPFTASSKTAPSHPVLLNPLRPLINYLKFNDDLLKRIEDAEYNQEIVVLIVDPWTVQLPRYSSRLKEFDKINFRYCTVLVPMNADDAENQTQREDLLRKLRETFYYRSRTVSEEMFYCAPINSCGEFNASLEKVLAKIQSDIRDSSSHHRMTSSYHRMSGLPIL